ncbi:MAG: hypothetical protein IPG34_16590 [Rhodocyclaceae bacterium]|nr:hypothetical protein [Rhodocyclaceae bacterium]
MSNTPASESESMYNGQGESPSEQIGRTSGGLQSLIDEHYEDLPVRTCIVLVSLGLVEAKDPTVDVIVDLAKGSMRDDIMSIDDQLEKDDIDYVCALLRQSHR